MTARIQSDPFRMSFPPSSGTRVPRAVNLVLGLWLFASSALWEQPYGARLDGFVVGVAIAVFSIVGSWAGAARFVNTALAVWLAFASFVLFRLEGPAAINAGVVSALVFVLSLFPNGPTRDAPRGVTEG